MSTDSRAPRTAAGRRLLEHLDNISVIVDDLAPDILAIEAEAAADPVAEEVLRLLRLAEKDYNDGLTEDESEQFIADVRRFLLALHVTILHADGRMVLTTNALGWHLTSNSPPHSSIIEAAITVNGHHYVHVAACPCPAMQAEMARLAPETEDGGRG